LKTIIIGNKIGYYDFYTIKIVVGVL